MGISGVHVSVVLAVVTASLAVLNGASPASAAVMCQGKRATIVGSARADTLLGSARSDVIWAGAGSDRVRGGGGDDWICAGGGNDLVRPGGGNDHTFAGAGADDVIDVGPYEIVVGGRGSDRLTGVRSQRGYGDLRGGGGADTLTCQDGRPKHAAPQGCQLLGGSGADHLRGSSYRDTLAGGPGVDVVRGFDGGDHFRIAGEGEQVFGGDDPDLVSYGAAQGSVVVDLGAGTGTGPGGLVDMLDDIEDVSGSRFADTLFGDERRNVLSGSSGNDTIYGGGEDDELRGWNGADYLDGSSPGGPAETANQLWGGNGTDQCVNGVATACEGTG